MGNEKERNYSALNLWKNYICCSKIKWPTENRNYFFYVDCWKLCEVELASFIKFYCPTERRNTDTRVTVVGIQFFLFISAWSLCAYFSMRFCKPLFVLIIGAEQRLFEKRRESLKYKQTGANMDNYRCAVWKMWKIPDVRIWCV